MAQFNVHDAKSNLSQLIEATLRGESVTIARRGRPAVRLVPVEENPEPASAYLALAGAMSGKLVEVDPDWWRASDEMADLFEGREAD
jgi:prevent-host-death family protein